MHIDEELEDSLWRVRWCVHAATPDHEDQRGSLEVWAHDEDHAVDVARSTLAERVRDKDLLLVGQPQEL